MQGFSMFFITISKTDPEFKLVESDARFFKHKSNGKTLENSKRCKLMGLHLFTGFQEHIDTLLNEFPFPYAENGPWCPLVPSKHDPVKPIYYAVSPTWCCTLFIFPEDESKVRQYLEEKGLSAVDAICSTDARPMTLKKM